MRYICEQCEKEADDSGPYERSDGEYECQECMERGECSRELRAELSKEAMDDCKQDERKH